MLRLSPVTRRWLEHVTQEKKATTRGNSVNTLGRPTQGQ